MSIGPEIKEVLAEVGTAYTVIRSVGNVTGEYLDYELNAQVTKPFIQEFFLDASLSYDTVLMPGDVLEFNVSGSRYLLMNKTPETFENQVISYAAVLYKSNVNVEVFRPSESDPHRHTFRTVTIWTSIGSIDALLTTPLFGNSLDTDEEIGLIGLQNREMYVPSSLGVKVLDRVWIDSSEYYRVESVKKRRYTDVDVLELGSDTRPLTVTTTSTTTSTTSSTSSTISTVLVRSKLSGLT